jgi:hypothetical protein
MPKVYLQIDIPRTPTPRIVFLKIGEFHERKISRLRDFFHNSRNLKTLEVSIRENLFSRNPLNSSIREIKLSIKIVKN